MLKLVINNNTSQIIGQFAPTYMTAKPFHDSLRLELGYKMANAGWSPKYKEHKWDGIISLYDRKEQTFPTGLAPRVIELLKEWEIPFKISDKRKVASQDADITTTFAEFGRALRDYQMFAVDEAMKQKRGIIAIPTGGGKTILSCELIARVKSAPTVFIVPSVALLRQTRREFEKYLRVNGLPAVIGQAGGGKCEVNMDGINVVTYHTALASFDEAYLTKSSHRGPAGTIAKEENVGERVKKTTAELESECKRAEHIYNLARKKAEEKMTSGQLLELNMKQFTALFKEEKKLFDKAQSVLDARYASIERKRKVRALMEATQCLIVDEAHLAAVVIQKLGEHASNAYFRWGMSVGCDSLIELRGGCFGCGWIGTIEAAWNKIVTSYGMIARMESDYEILDISMYDIYTRGWEDNQFTWKTINRYIRHKCEKNGKSIDICGDTLVLTDDHSIFKIKSNEYIWLHNHKKPIGSLSVCRSDELNVGDTVLIDNGSNWLFGSQTQSNIIDVSQIIANSSLNANKVRVCVNFSKISHVDLGCSYKLWWQRKNRSKYGPNISLNQYIQHADILPEPTSLHCERANGVTVSAKINLENWAYMFGFWLGDGWVTGNRVCFAVENNMLHKFMSEIDSLSGITWNKKYIQKSNGSCEVRYSSAIMVEIFRHIFGDVSCYTKTIPGDWIINWSEKSKRELLRGLIDSDGHYSITGKNKMRTCYTTTSINLAKTLMSLLRSLGVKGSVNIRNIEKANILGGVINGRQIQSNTTSYQVHWSTHAYNGNNNDLFGLRSKYEHGDLSYTEHNIKKIEESFISGYVYDLEMNGHPSFVANGCLVHNSATPFREDNQEIRIQGTFGRKLVQISASDLINMGHLVPPSIYMCKIPFLDKNKEDDYRDIYDKHITNCWERNFRIKQFAEEFKESGRPVLIFVDHIDHGKILEGMIKDSLFVAGDDEGDDDPGDAVFDYRKDMLDKCEANEHILIATSWAYTGIDAPAISVLVLAGSVRAATTTYQQIGRVLRPCKETNKYDAIVIDFISAHPDLREHSTRRKKVYQQESAWTVHIIT